MIIAAMNEDLWVQYDDCGCTDEQWDYPCPHCVNRFLHEFLAAVNGCKEHKLKQLKQRIIVWEAES